jgi:fibronectin-binding autotransporter adhesin
MNTKRPLRLIVVLAALTLAAFPSTAATKVWDGSASGLWTTAANWASGVAPVNGDALVFPGLVTRLLTTNAPGAATNFTAITLTGNGYSLFSSILSLTNGLTNAGPVRSFNTLRAPVRLRQSQTWAVNALNTLVVQSNLNLSGVTLRLNLAGDLQAEGNFFGSGDGNLIKLGIGRLELNGNNNAVHELRVDAGTLAVDGVVTADLFSISNGVVFAGAGEVSGFTIGGTFRIGTNTGAATGSLKVTAPGTATFLPGGSMEAQVFGPAPGIEYDQLSVNTPPDLSHGTLSVLRSSAFPLSVGQRFVIITNTDISPITTTFTNLPQGAFITNALAPVTVFQISYVGGDGNDVELTVVDGAPTPAATRVWDGGGADGFWQSAANWVNDQVPSANDAVEFTGAQRCVNTNNLAPGIALDFIRFNATNAFTLRGNPLRLLNGLTNALPGNHVIDLPLELGASQGWFLNGGILTLQSPLSGDAGLTVLRDDPGTLNLVGTLPNSFSGTFRIRQGVVLLGKSDGVTAVAGPMIIEAPALSTVVQVLASEQFSNSPPISVLSEPGHSATLVFNSASATNRIGTLTLDGGACEVRAGAALHIAGDLNGTAATGTRLVLTFDSTDADAPKMAIAGDVDPGNTFLSVAAQGVTVGAELMAIRNDGASPIGGAFRGAPEGGLLTNAPYVFRISYVGGDGNDVVLTVSTNVILTAVTSVWDGGGANGFWQTAANWLTNIKPIEGDRLEFAGNLRTISTNNFTPGTIFDTLALSSTNPFTLRGNALRLVHGLQTSTNALTHVLDLPVELMETQLWHVDGGQVNVRSSLTGGPVTLSKDGPGMLQFLGSQPNSFAGTLMVRGSQLTLAKASGVPAVAGPLILQATDSDVALLSVLANGQFSNSPPVMLLGNSNRFARMLFNSNAGSNRIGSLSLNSSRIDLTARAALEIAGDLDSPGNNSSTLTTTFDSTEVAGPKMTVSGRVGLTNIQLILNASAVGPNVSLLLIRNDGASPVQGRFIGLAEGALVVSGSRSFHITYVGGDGNDVTLLAPAQALPSTLTGIVDLPAGGTEVTGIGVAGQSYILEATTNLNPTAIWLPLLTNTADGAGLFQFIDSSSTNFPIRFYRVSSP